MDDFFSAWDALDDLPEDGSKAKLNEDLLLGYTTDDAEKILGYVKAEKDDAKRAYLKQLLSVCLYQLSADEEVSQDWKDGRAAEIKSEAEASDGAYPLDEAVGQELPEADKAELKSIKEECSKLVDLMPFDDASKLTEKDNIALCTTATDLFWGFFFDFHADDVSADMDKRLPDVKKKLLELEAKNDRLRLKEAPAQTNEGLLESTVKAKDGKWVNRGKAGEHGEFVTKRKADAQRKAIYASGWGK